MKSLKSGDDSIFALGVGRLLILSSCVRASDNTTLNPCINLTLLAVCPRLRGQVLTFPGLAALQRLRHII